MKKILYLIPLLFVMATIPAFAQVDSGEDEKIQPFLTANIDKTEYDFGNLTPTSVELTTFMVANMGQKTLKITDFKTSCGCTSVVVAIDGEKSPNFSMHTQSNWVGEIAPGAEAEVEVTYDATVHPAEGDVTRFIYFNTNDPKNPNPELSIKLNVQ